MKNPTKNSASKLGGATKNNRAGFSRRDFLKQSGALIVSFSVLGAAVEPALAQFVTGGTPGSPNPSQLDSWIAINADGTVTGYTGKSELGQGIVTAQHQLVAEELCVPFDRVELIVCDTDYTPDQGYTSGSQSHPTNFNHANLAQACATAREALVKLAADHLGVPADQLSAADGAVSSKSDPSKKVSYADLIGNKKFNLTLDKNAKRKPASEWTILGTPVKRPDMPAMVTARFEYVHNIRRPGMLHGQVVRPPTVGATVVNVNDASVAKMPGVVKVVVKKNFVGVVAEKPYQALQAASELKVDWSAGSGLPKFDDFYEHLRTQEPRRDTLLVNSKDVDQSLAQSGATVVKATYHHPYQMHGSMGSSCAVADVQNGKATLWSATQGVWFMRSTAAMVLGMKPEDVHVIFTRGSGCYGINGADAVSYDAAILSQAVGKPVRIQLTRKDEMAWENYGNAIVADERAVLDAQGNIVAWDHESWVPVLGSRPGRNRPGNVITGLLVGFEPEEFAARTPAPEPNRYNNNSNAIPSYVAGNIGGKKQGTGNIASERVLVHNVVSPFWTGPLRSPERLQNTFSHESFMDEIAAHAKADPVAFRLKHLSNPRLSEMVTNAAKAANWDARPSPKPASRKNGVASGRGVSCVAYEGDNGYSAMVAEVEVDQNTGKVTVKRMVVSVDCGPISNPDGLRQQTEGGTLQGMSRALGEEVTWDDQKVTSVDWASYHSLPLGFDIPKIEVVLNNRPDEEATGAGELAITIVAAAIANAIFDATGARIRQVPFTPERVKAALREVAAQRASHHATTA
ncbi:MAG TPA: molybdopterin cofactor-binding domain-containing protein [Candidatus Acidoferrales bacterium]|jgi:CO/xanthine dehydrogenase Mo-binding subunit|nr:molybdopterin cofactor-binding domain-containing protein [Candidatus Acidoferrales bacterium]